MFTNDPRNCGVGRARTPSTGIVVHSQTLPLVTWEYEVSGESKTESTAKRTVGGAAIGNIFGAFAGGGKEATIEAGTGASVGAGSEIICSCNGLHRVPFSVASIGFYALLRLKTFYALFRLRYSTGGLAELVPL